MATSSELRAQDFFEALFGPQAPSEGVISPPGQTWRGKAQRLVNSRAGRPHSNFSRYVDSRTSALRTNIQLPESARKLALKV